MFIARPNPATLALRPIHARAGSAIGIEPLVTQAQRQQVAGAVNAGFFNRNNQLPLGAVRKQWPMGFWPYFRTGRDGLERTGRLVHGSFCAL